MKKFFALLLFFIGISNLWAQLPTPTPQPGLILKSDYLNDLTLTPPLKVFIFRDFRDTSKYDYEIVDDKSKAETIFGSSLTGSLWETALGGNVQKDDIYFEEFKIFKKINPSSCLVKLPIPNSQKWRYESGNRDPLMGLFSDDHSQIFYLTSNNDSTLFEEFNEGEQVNVVVKTDGFFTDGEGGNSKNYIKLDVVPPDEPNVWILSTPTPSIEKYDFFDLSTQGTNLIGKKAEGMVKILQKVNDTDYLISFEPGEGYQRTFYLTNAGKLNAVDNQNVLVGVKVVGTKSYTSVLGDEKTVMEVELIGFSIDGKTIIKAK